MASTKLPVIMFVVLLTVSKRPPIRAHPQGGTFSFGAPLTTTTTTPSPFTGFNTGHSFGSHPPTKTFDHKSGFDRPLTFGTPTTTTAGSPPLTVRPPPAPTPPPPQAGAFSGFGAQQTANGPLVSVGSGVQNTVPSSGGVSHSGATTHLQGGGGFGFGTSSVRATAEGGGRLPVTSTSNSALVSTGPAALGTSQSGTIGTQASNVTGVPSKVTAAQGQSSVISTNTGFTAGYQHSGTVSAGGEGGPRADLGDVVQQQTQAAQQQEQQIKGTAAQANSVDTASVLAAATEGYKANPAKF